MARYPLKAEKLLDTAERLVPREAERGRPAYADHRRAISTAYYAVFHAIGGRVAEAVFGGSDEAFLHRIRRWIGHGDIREVAIWVCQLEGERSGSPPAHIRDLLAPRGASSIDPDTLSLAEGFLELNDKREQADYNHEAVFSRADTLTQIGLARAVVERVEEAQTNSARHFFGLVAMRAKIQPR
jgi:hypothetical protein